MTDRPLAIDLFTGLHGWSVGLAAEGFRTVGFDIEDMSEQFGEEKPEHFSLVIQDVLTLHGSQFKDAALIVASPPCQFFSYTAMPWKRSKERAARTRADPALLEKELSLFNACFRIRREASEAAGRNVPLVIENVRGAQPWVGNARWNAGSMYFWEDVPALMPEGHQHIKVQSFRFDGSGGSFQTAATKEPSPQSGRRTTPGLGARFTSMDCGIEAEVRGAWFNDAPRTSASISSSGSKSPARKAASARIAKIPFEIASYIARFYRP